MLKPLEVLWRAPAIVSLLLLGEGLALVMALAPGATGDRWVTFGLASLIIQWITLSTLALLYLFRRRLAALSIQRLAWIVMGLLLLATWMVLGTAWAALGSALVGDPEQLPSLVLRVTTIALTVGSLAMVAFLNYWRASQLAIRAKQSQLEALQARIRPHFLFNTLNTGAALIRARPGAAEKLLLDLADLFRAALAAPHEITLAEELALAKGYLEIEALRFGSRLQTQWQLPDPLPAVLVPALSIQPLIENAIRHGIESSPEGGRLDIIIESEPGHVRISVRNPIRAGFVTQIKGHQVGLASVRARIEAVSGGLGQLETRIEGDCYVATLTIPTPIS